MIKQALQTGWTLRAVGDEGQLPAGLRGAVVEGRVPGCVHTDLMRAGKIPDPYVGMNERELQWIGLTDWQYQTTFEVDAKLLEHERVDLVCDGLDTVARVELNGELVAQTQNMHRSYRFDVKSKLKRGGGNTLTITFASPVKYAAAMQEKLKPRPYVNGPGGAFNFIRKMACNFGWDWSPVLVTSGIWKGVRLEGWNFARIDAVRPVVKAINAIHHQVEFEVDLELKDPSRDWWVHVFITSPDGKLFHGVLESGRRSKRLTIDVTSSHQWWPVGHGAPALYDVYYTVTLWGDNQNEHPFDEGKCRIGLRTVELDTSPDDIGATFALKVNDKPIYCKGFNWIPDDVFLDRACTRERYRERIQQAVDAGANMLRVWGGGIYETDDFYDICDEMGVMVWQDFLFACAMYPEEEPIWSEVEAEVRENVARLASHPSLVLYNGCNENIWAYKDWGWQTHDDVKGRTWGKNYYLEMLPRIVREVDRSRPYWAASPWSGDENVETGLAPNLSTHGNMHVWTVWFNEDYASYRKIAPRFCSEFGFQGPANYATIAEVVPEEKRDWGSAEIRHRQRFGNVERDDGDRKSMRLLQQHFNVQGLSELLAGLEPPDPKAEPPVGGLGHLKASRAGLPSKVNFDDLHYLLQVNQARALTTAVEWFRSRQPVNMGALYWQLNEQWPNTMGFAAIDGAHRRKPLWYATRRFYAPRLLTIQPEGNALVLFASNDSDEAWSGEIWLRRMDFWGKELGELRVKLDAAARTNVRVAVLPTGIAQPVDRSKEFIVAQVGDMRTFWYFLPDKELNYPEPQFESSVEQRDGAARLTLKPKVLLRDVIVAADRIDPDAQMEVNLMTILPGEEFGFVIRSVKELKAEELTRVPVMQCANRFGVASAVRTAW